MLITFKQACAELQIQPSTLYQWSATGLVPVIRVGRVLRYDRESLIAWFKDGSFEKAKRETLQGKNGKAH